MDELISGVREDSPGVGRRQLLKAGAWAVPAVIVVAGAPLAAATGNPAYEGPAFQAINAGAAPQTTGPKVYSLGSGPIRGKGDLAPGVRFGSIGGSFTQTAFVTFTPSGTQFGPITAASTFEKFGGLTVSAPTANGNGSYTFTITVNTTSGDPRLTYAGVASITVLRTGTYAVVGSGHSASFTATGLETTSGSNATTLTSQAIYA